MPVVGRPECVEWCPDSPMSINTDKTEPPTADLTIDNALDALGNDRRRTVVEVLSELDEDSEEDAGDLSFRELAAAVAEQEYGPNYDTDERKTVYVSLYQCHIPKLDDLGIVRYTGTSSGPIRPGPNFQVARDYLDSIREIDRKHGHGSQGKGEGEGEGDEEGTETPEESESDS